MSNSKILVLGSGFSAALVASNIEKSLCKLRQPYELIHVSEKKYFFYQELICDLLSGVAVFNDIVSDYRGLGIYKPGVSFIESQIINIDLDSQIVETNQGVLNYDYLVLAIDESSNDIQTDIFNCKTPFNVLKLKEKIWKNLQAATFESKTSLRKRLLTFSVIGADAAGIQISCLLADYINQLIKSKFQEIKKSQISINLLDEKSELDLKNNRFYNASIFYNLNKRNINLVMNSKIKYDEGKIEILSKSGMDSGVIISTKSKYLPDVLNRLPLPKDSDCRFFVDLYLKAENYNNVFIIGEKSACLDLSEKCQPNSIGLKIQAKICANNIISMINNNPLKPLNQKTFVEFMPIGYRNCLITIKDFSFDGLLAWLLFRIIHLSTYIGIKSKVSAFLKLLFSLINPVDTDIFLLEEISEYKREKITV